MARVVGARAGGGRQPRQQQGGGGAGMVPVMLGPAIVPP